MSERIICYAARTAFAALVLGLLSLAGCVGLPNSEELHDGWDAPLEDDRIAYTITKHWAPPYAACTALWAERERYDLIALATAGAGMVGGCAVGKPGECTIHYWALWPNALEHEKEHCRGYKDLVY